MPVDESVQRQDDIDLTTLFARLIAAGKFYQSIIYQILLHLPDIFATGFGEMTISVRNGNTVTVKSTKSVMLKDEENDNLG